MRCTLVVTAVLLFWSAAGETGALRNLSEADKVTWKRITDASLSPDGQWLIYSVSPTAMAGDTTIVVRRIQDGLERKYSAGSASLGAGGVTVSPSGRWVAFRAVSRAGVPAALALVNLSTGSLTEIPGVQGFAWNGAQSDWIAIRRQSAAGDPAQRAPSAPESQDAGFDLTLVRARPDSDRIESETLAGVTDFAFDSTGSRLAWTTAREIRVRDLAAGQNVVLERMPAAQIYRNLTWSESGHSLAAIRSESSQFPVYSLVVLRQLQKTASLKTTFDASTWDGFPADYAICPAPVKAGSFVRPRLPLMWRDDEQGLFFKICSRTQQSEGDRSTPANLSIWRGEDDQLPGMRTAGGVADYLAFVELDSRRFVQLADPRLRDVEPHARGTWLLAFDWRTYGWQNDIRDSRSSQRRDYSLVELATGRRTSLIKNLRVGVSNGNSSFMSAPPQVSPDGSFVLYKNGGDYITYEIASGRSRNLTAHLPTKFYYEENPPLSGRQYFMGDQHPPVLQGWTEDSKSVLLSDYFDVWLLPMRGGTARNLTRNGRIAKISYARTLYSPSLGQYDAPADSPVDVNRPIYFWALELNTRRTGLARLMPKTPLELLRWYDSYARFFKARSADVQIIEQQTPTVSADYYLADASWQAITRLTDVNPQQSEFHWVPPPRRLTYRTAHGDELHAILYLPVGYERSNTYPMLVDIYEQQSGSLGTYIDPNANIHLFPFLQNGYAVLWPDILPREGDPGAAAVEGVEAAVSAAVSAGVADSQRLGLFGHSYGAYETNFVISQTNMFKAAVAYAGMSNLWSDCGAIYLDRWPRSLYCENGQESLGGPWWDQWDAYLRNSPLFHARQIRTPLLLAHGDQDRAVSFSQSVELFNTLRRLNRQVVMLQYRGEGHDFNSDSLLDFHTRMMQFLDHYLKGAPAPSWLIDSAAAER